MVRGVAIVKTVEQVRLDRLQLLQGWERERKLEGKSRLPIEGDFPEVLLLRQIPIF